MPPRRRLKIRNSKVCHDESRTLFFPIKKMESPESVDKPFSDYGLGDVLFRGRMFKAQETNDGIAYLMALKQATGAKPGAAVAPARAQDRMLETATEQNSETFHGTEKRRSPRYRCEGSAEVREDGCDVRTRATSPTSACMAAMWRRRRPIPQERCCT